MSKATIPVLAERLNHTFAAGTFDAPHGFVLASGKLWAVAQMIPCRIVVFEDQDNLADANVTPFAGDGLHDRGLDIVYDSVVNNSLYVLHRNLDRSLISAVDPGSIALTDAVNDTTEGNTNGSLAVTPTHLFCGTFFGTIGVHTVEAVINKYALSNLATKTSVTLTGFGQCHCLRYDGTNLYATGSSSAGGTPWVARINPTTLAATVAALPALGFPTDDLAFFGDYIYVGLELLSTGTILRIHKSTLAISQIVVKPPTANFYGVFADATHLWAVTTLVSGQGKMIRIDPTTLEQRLYTFNAGEVTDGPNEIVFVAPYMFVTFFQSGCKVSRLRIPTT